MRWSRRVPGQACLQSKADPGAHIARRPGHGLLRYAGLVFMKCRSPTVAFFSSASSFFARHGVHRQENASGGVDGFADRAHGYRLAGAPPCSNTRIGSQVWRFGSFAFPPQCRWSLSYRDCAMAGFITMASVGPLVMDSPPIHTLRIQNWIVSWRRLPIIPCRVSWRVF